MLVAVLEQLDDRIVELDQACIQPLRPTAQVRNADRFRIDLLMSGLDLINQKNRVVHAVPVEITT